MLDAETEIQVTAGANGGIYCAMLSFLEQDDQVLMFEPFFDQYICETTFNGGEPVFIPLLPPASKSADAAADGASSSVKSGKSKRDAMPRADEWKVDWEATEKAMSNPKAKVFILNTPNSG